MNVEDIRSTLWTQQKFWALSAPLSLAIMIFVFIVAFRHEWLWFQSRRTSPFQSPSSPVHASSDIESQKSGSSARTARSWSWAWALPAGTRMWGKAK